MLNFGLIGLGRHGIRYANHLLAGDVAEARLVAVCRRDAAQGEAYARAHGVRFHPDFRALIADRGVDAVLVVTPPALATEVALAAVAARKPLLMEKPLARTGQEARGIVEAAERAGVPVMTAQTVRFTEAVVALKGARARVGAARYLALTNRIEPRPDLIAHAEEYGGRGVLLEIGIHSIDLVRFLTDEDVGEVRCELEYLPGTGGLSRGPDVRALVSLKTRSGLPCVLDVSRVTGGRVSRVEWVGADGQVMADWVHHRVRMVTQRDRVEEHAVPDRATVVATMAAFANALGTGGAMPITGRDGLKAVEIADACYASAESGTTVKL